MRVRVCAVRACGVAAGSSVREKNYAGGTACVRVRYACHAQPRACACGEGRSVCACVVGGAWKVTPHVYLACACACNVVYHLSRQCPPNVQNISGRMNGLS